MSKTIITGFDMGPVIVSGDHSTVNVNKNATLMLGGSFGGLGPIMENISSPATNHHNTYNINGTVIGSEVALYLAGAFDKITVGETGTIEALYGLAVTGAKNSIVNEGKIIGEAGGGSSGAGIYAMGSNGTTIDNNGFITGSVGITYAGDKGSILNGEDGIIIGNTTGIVAEALDSTTFKLVNHGYLAGKSGVAFAGGNADIAITNDGIIKGQVVFGEGDDLLDNRGGSLENITVVGGAGNDTLVVDDNKHFLLENAGEGNDTVKASVSYTLAAEVERLFLLGNTKINGTGTDGDNTIKGNAGKNTLSGLGGVDQLDGGLGNDRLKGGAGSDVFHFSTGYGADTVLDFTHTEDKIDISDWAGVNKFGKVLANAHNQGADVLIEHGTDSLLLIGVHKGELTVDDFVFV